MEKIIKYQKQIFWTLVVIVLLNFVFAIFLSRDEIFQKFDYKKWEDKYNKSQWIVPESKNQISDSDLYVFVGSKLINGYDPTLVNAEMPPLGKYLIGFFESTTGIVGVYGIIFSASSLILFFFFNKIIFKSNILSIIPVALFSSELLFREQIGISLLDLQYLSLLFLIFMFLLKKRYILTGIIAGLFMATKSPFIVIVLYASLFLFMLIRKKLNFKYIFVMPVWTLGVYTLVYLKYFLIGHTLIQFLKVQKFLIHFYQTGAKGVFGAVFPMIFTGYWFTWFNNNQFIKEWTIFWPVTFIISLAVIYKLIKNKLSDEGVLLMCIWVIFYTAFLMFTPIFSRYLLLLIPFMYNLAVWGLLKLTKPQLLSQLH